jgi:pimeloyl-ACP methyl ester carboxylesterase
MNLELLEDFERNTDKLNIKKAASALKIPFLIIHGKEDISVKPSEAEELYAAAPGDKTRLEIIENTGHTFGVVHPFAGTTPQFELVIEKTIGFLKQK